MSGRCQSIHPHHHRQVMNTGEYLIRCCQEIYEVSRVYYDLFIFSFLIFRFLDDLFGEFTSAWSRSTLLNSSIVSSFESRNAKSSEDLLKDEKDRSILTEVSLIESTDDQLPPTQPHRTHISPSSSTELSTSSMVSPIKRKSSKSIKKEPAELDTSIRLKPAPTVEKPKFIRMSRASSNASNSATVN